MTSAQSTVASSLGLTFTGVNTGNHNMLSMDQQDNAAVSKRDGIAGSNKFHFPRLISLRKAINSLYRRKAIRHFFRAGAKAIQYSLNITKTASYNRLKNREDFSADENSSLVSAVVKVKSIPIVIFVYSGLYVTRSSKF